MLSADSASETDRTGLKMHRPGIARVWNSVLGGKDNFAVDRDVVSSIAEIAPWIRNLALANDRFRIRACAYLASIGITQYVDCGPGLPATASTHEVVQLRHHAARVLYVDNDPLVLVHGRALLAINDMTKVVAGDIFDPMGLLNDPEVQGFLDWSRPVAILQTGTLHYSPGDDPAVLMKTYADAIAPGSYTVISHLADPQQPAISDLIRQVEQRYANATMEGIWFRTVEEIHAMFPDQELIAPSLVGCDEWRSDGHRETGMQDCIVGGVGRKP
jgi:hypothetical protein